MKGLSGAVTTALLGGLVAVAAPVDAAAGNVGYFMTQDGTTAASCFGGSAASAITAAGHTPVPVSTLDSASLAPLDGLVISQCSTPYQGSAAVDTAVQNGLRVMIDTQNEPVGTALPGDPALVFDGVGSCSDLSITPGAPVASGPGGTLTDSSLDNGYICSGMGSVVAASLPAGGQSFVQAAAQPGSAVAFAYPTGSGVVAVSISQWMYALPGAGYAGYGLGPGVLTYYTNTVAWMMSTELAPATTCASEGYTGTKLLWCQNICEKGYTGATLQTWIHRWVRQFRDLPYCAVEPANPPS